MKTFVFAELVFSHDPFTLAKKRKLIIPVATVGLSYAYPWFYMDFCATSPTQARAKHA